MNKRRFFLGAAATTVLGIMKLNEIGQSIPDTAPTQPTPDNTPTAPSRAVTALETQRTRQEQERQKFVADSRRLISIGEEVCTHHGHMMQLVRELPHEDHPAWSDAIDVLERTAHNSHSACEKLWKQGHDLEYSIGIGTWDGTRKASGLALNAQKYAKEIIDNFKIGNMAWFSREQNQLLLGRIDDSRGARLAGYPIVDGYRRSPIPYGNPTAQKLRAAVATLATQKGYTQEEVA